MENEKLTEMESAIYEKIKSLGGGVTFVELEQIPGFTGTKQFTIPGLYEMNIWLWFTISQAAVDAISSLVRKKLIRLSETSIFVYLVDGVIPTVPPAKESRRYKKERWQPAVFNCV